MKKTIVTKKEWNGERKKRKNNMKKSDHCVGMGNIIICKQFVIIQPQIEYDRQCKITDHPGIKPT